MAVNERLDFNNIILDEVPTITPSAEDLMLPNNINSFINDPKIFNLGMEYGMLKIRPSPSYKDLAENNLLCKADDPKFKIRVREQNLNELELFNRSNKFFEHQLKAFNSVNSEQETSIPTGITTSNGEFFTLYEIYVSIVEVYNSNIMDSDGRYVSTLPDKTNKRVLKETSDLTNNTNQSSKRRKSLRSQHRKNYSSEEHDNIVINNNINNSSVDYEKENEGTDWKIPDPKHAKFLKNPNNKKKLTFSSHSFKFWKSLSEDYETLYNYYIDYLRDYISAIYNYDGAKPWSINKKFKTNGISIIHHMSTLSDSDIKNEETDENINDDDNNDVCKKCQKTKRLYQCNYCQELYHKTCIPALTGKYGKVCDNCLLGNFEYGFQELEKTLTINEFKQKYAGKDSYSIKDINDIMPLEKEFWNIVYGDKLVKSFYGADIHNDVENYISGFENQKNKEISQSFLNLMNLPSDKNTLLPLLNDITGISLPWCYFGSRFSVFGIHLEDHFTYSINYQFEGECKIWYCIKIKDSDKFHEYISSRYPDFMRRQKDILHQLTATISPYDKHLHNTMGITFYKAVQKPGEYIITFPKCWHFGFNLGFNHNEAVNFILPNWIPFGMEADRVYRRDGRKNVFDIYKLIEKNIIVNNDRSYSSDLFTRVESLIEELNTVEEVLIRETMYNDYKSFELDLTNFTNSFMVNEIGCDHCKKICSFSMVLVFNDTSLFDCRFVLDLKQILINSKKINNSDDQKDYENLNNFIINEDVNKKKINLYCTACYIKYNKTIVNYLLTQSYYLKDSLNKNKVFKKDDKFNFPIDFE